MRTTHTAIRRLFLLLGLGLAAFMLSIFSGESAHDTSHTNTEDTLGSTNHPLIPNARASDLEIGIIALTGGSCSTGTGTGSK